MAIWTRKRKPTTSTTSTTTTTTTTTTATLTTTVTPAPIPPTVIKCVSAPAQSNSAHLTTATLGKQLGATHYRYAFEIGWGLEALDSVLTTCRNLGLKLVLCVFRADRIIPTDDAGRAGFASTCRDLAARCGNTITHLEVWNEPNHKPFVIAQNPQAYARLMIATHRLIKTTFGSTITTITGGLSPEPSPYAPHEFWDACCQADPAFIDSFDLVGIHPYCFPHSPLGSESWNAMAQTVILWAKTGSQYGRTVEFAATEYGAPSNWQGFTEATQAQWYADYRTAFQTRGPVWRLVSPYTILDGNAGAGESWGPSAGLYRTDRTEKPAATVYRNQ